MESKHILRVGLVLGFMLLFSIYSGSNGLKHEQTQRQAELESVFPYNGIFHSVAMVFDDALHSDGMHAPGTPSFHATYQELPPALVSGVINQKAIWQVKVGPFYDMKPVEELTQYLLQQQHQVLLKVDLDESGYTCTAYVHPTTQKTRAEALKAQLASRYSHPVEIASDYM